MPANQPLLKDIPRYQQVAALVDREVIPALNREGYRSDTEHPHLKNSGKSFFSWWLYRRPSPERLYYLNVTANSELDITAFVFLLDDPTASDQEALQAARNAARHPMAKPSIYLGMLPLFRGYLTPYRFLLDQGTAPLRWGASIKREAGTFDRMIFGISIFLTEIFLIPIKRIGYAGMRSWLNSEPDRALRRFRSMIKRIISEAPEFEMKIRTFCDEKIASRP